MVDSAARRRVAGQRNQRIEPALPSREASRQFPAAGVLTNGIGAPAEVLRAPVRTETYCRTGSARLPPDLGRARAVGVGRVGRATASNPRKDGDLSRDSASRCRSRSRRPVCTSTQPCLRKGRRHSPPLWKRYAHRQCGARHCGFSLRIDPMFGNSRVAPCPPKGTGRVLPLGPTRLLIPNEPSRSAEGQWTLIFESAEGLRRPLRFRCLSADRCLLFRGRVHVSR
jgi:hypothetical protein